MLSPFINIRRNNYVENNIRHQNPNKYEIRNFTL